MVEMERRRQAQVQLDALKIMAAEMQEALINEDYESYDLLSVQYASALDDHFREFRVYEQYG